MLQTLALIQPFREHKILAKWCYSHDAKLINNERKIHSFFEIFFIVKRNRHEKYFCSVLIATNIMERSMFSNINLNILLCLTGSEEEEQAGLWRDQSRFGFTVLHSAEQQLAGIACGCSGSALSICCGRTTAQRGRGAYATALVQPLRCGWQFRRMLG